MTKSRSVAEILAAIGEAFKAHDAKGIAAQFADDGVFVNAVGDLAGDTYTGPTEVRGYFEKVFADTPDVAWVPRATPILIGNDQAVTQWCRKATAKTGEVLQWYGVDLYAFRDGMVVKKDTYVKNVTVK